MRSSQIERRIAVIINGIKITVAPGMLRTVV
jgi:hypothetical protein